MEKHEKNFIFDALHMDIVKYSVFQTAINMQKYGHMLMWGLLSVWVVVFVNIYHNHITSSAYQGQSGYSSWREMALHNLTKLGTASENNFITRTELADAIEAKIMNFNYSRTNSYELLENDILDYLRALQQAGTRLVDNTARRDDDDRVHVHLAAAYHSGSSFTGEILSAHPDVFYLFEPLLLLDMSSLWYQPRQNQHLHAHYMRQLLDCRFAEINNKSMQLFPHSVARNKRRRDGFLDLIFPLQMNTYALNGSELTSYMDRMLQGFSDICRIRRVTVAKTIRSDKLLFLLPLLVRGVKVLNLHRDPRGVMYSKFRPQNPSNSSYYWKDRRPPVKLINNQCSNDDYNFNLLRSLYPIRFVRDILQANFRLLRYEDLAFKPIETSQAIYDFMNVTMTAAVVREIENAVGGEVRVPLNQTADQQHIRLPKSGLIATKWREYLPLDWVKMIESRCITTMKALGYVHLRRDKKITKTNFRLFDENLNDETVSLYNVIQAQLQDLQ